MTKFALALALALFGSVASAQEISFPDFGLQTRFEQSEIRKDANVLAYVAHLGGGSFKVVSAGGNQVYTVVTSKGCAFSARFIYGKPYLSANRVDQVVVYKDAVCN